MLRDRAPREVGGVGSDERRTEEPWQRGVDEAIYYGAHRAHDSEAAMDCSPPRDPSNEEIARNPWFHIDPVLASATTQSNACSVDEDCSTHPLCPDGKCACAQRSPASDRDNFCFRLNPEPCDPKQHQSTCKKWGLYLGPRVQSACEPRDSTYNFDCCTAAYPGKSVYDFAKKLKPNPPAVEPGIWRYDRETNNAGQIFYPCNDDGATRETGCRYDARHYRDRAKDFILRHSGEPFFLAIGFQATHADNQAPSRTTEHYLYPKPGDPGPGEKYWGALEEVDAAVGEVLTVLEGPVCDGASANAKIGVSCASDADCDGGVCISLAQDTLILFTADQGAPNSNFGQPLLRGGKLHVSEGGIRVGLLAWGPGVLGTGTGVERRLAENKLGSHVDLFATIAHAAGYQPTDTQGHVSVKVCGDHNRTCNSGADCDRAEGGRRGGNPRKICTGDDDCGAWCAGRGQCVPGVCSDRSIEGRSLLPVLRGDDEDPDSEVEVRDAVFAQYGGDGMTMVSRPELYEKICDRAANGNGNGIFDETECDYAARVCSYQSYRPNSLEPLSIDRTVVGSSCVACDGNDLCGPAAPCTTQAKVCLDSREDDFADCSDDNPATPPQFPRCDIDAKTRCRTTDDCEDTLNHVCKQVVVPCNGCRPASWKLRGDFYDNVFQTKELFDLASNPEENPDSDCKAAGGSIGAVSADMAGRVEAWWDCVEDGDPDCDKLGSAIP